MQVSLFVSFPRQIRRSPLLLHELPPFARPGRGAEDSESDSSSMLSGEGSSSSSRRTSSASFVVTRSEGDGIQLHPVSAILSSLPRSDLLLLSCRLPKSRSTFGSSSSTLHPSPLPVSPYPARSQTAIRAHFVSHHRPDDSEGWTPWVGGTWSKWVKGRVLGYRDFAGRETEVRSSRWFGPKPLPNDEFVLRSLLCSQEHTTRFRTFSSVLSRPPDRAAGRSSTKSLALSLASCLVRGWTTASRVCEGGAFRLSRYTRYEFFFMFNLFKSYRVCCVVEIKLVLTLPCLCVDVQSARTGGEEMRCCNLLSYLTIYFMSYKEPWNHVKHQTTCSHNVSVSLL